MSQHVGKNPKLMSSRGQPVLLAVAVSQLPFFILSQVSLSQLLLSLNAQPHLSWPEPSLASILLETELCWSSGLELWLSRSLRRWEHVGSWPSGDLLYLWIPFELNPPCMSRRVEVVIQVGGKMAQWVKPLVTKSDNLSSIPRTHVVEKPNPESPPHHLPNK